MSVVMLSRIQGRCRSELLPVSGDITSYGSGDETGKLLISILGGKRKPLCRAGDMDNSRVNDYLDESGMNLHGQTPMAGGRVGVKGAGAFSPTPLKTIRQLSKKQPKRPADEARRPGENHITQQRLYL